MGGVGGYIRQYLVAIGPPYRCACGAVAVVWSGSPYVGLGDVCMCGAPFTRPEFNPIVHVRYAAG